LAADIGTCADAHLRVEGMIGAEHAAAQDACLARNRNGFVQGPFGMRIFGAQIDVALVGAHRDSCNRHALDEHEGVALHDHAVGEGSRVAFICVAYDVLTVRLRLKHRLPLDAGTKARAAASAKAGFGHLADDFGWRHGKRLAQAPEAAMRFVILQRQRISDPAACEGEACLTLEKRYLLRNTEQKWVRSAEKEATVEKRRNI